MMMIKMLVQGWRSPVMQKRGEKLNQLNMRTLAQWRSPVMQKREEKLNQLNMRTLAQLILVITQVQAKDPNPVVGSTRQNRKSGKKLDQDLREETVPEARVAPSEEIPPGQ